MSYGIMSEHTRTYVLERAATEGISVDKLGLEPTWEECSSCEGRAESPTFICENEECEDGVVRPNFLREIAVIYGGALDETFYLDDLYAVNIADWLAEQCQEQAKEDNEHWEIVLSIPHFEDSTTVYRVSSWDDE